MNTALRTLFRRVPAYNAALLVPRATRTAEQTQSIQAVIDMAKSLSARLDGNSRKKRRNDNDDDAYDGSDPNGPVTASTASRIERKIDNLFDLMERANTDAFAAHR